MSVASRTRSSSGGTTTSGGDTTCFRVTTYNVLSSALACPNQYPRFDPKILDPHQRLPRIIAKLKEEVDKGAIICLQEVSRSWVGGLHAFFANNGYHFVYAPYGTPFNGFMGVGMAWPIPSFKALDVEVYRVSDSLYLPRAPPPSWFQRLKLLLLSITGALFPKLRARFDTPPDPWELAKNRYNLAILARLSDITTNQRLCVCTYHMPCMFQHPEVMVIHTALLFKKVESWVGRDPYVVAGDFNFKPEEGDGCYRMVHDGYLGKKDPAYPPPHPSNKDWTPSLKNTMRSALKQKWKEEPAFTTHAQMLDRDPFTGTLDYIWVSNAIQTRDAIKLPDEPQELMPNDQEPSDHYLLWADLKIQKYWFNR